MPFESRSQQKYLFAKKPEVAKRFAAETPKGAYKHLPEHVGKAIHGMKPHTPKAGKGGFQKGKGK